MFLKLMFSGWLFERISLQLIMQLKVESQCVAFVKVTLQEPKSNRRHKFVFQKHLRRDKDSDGWLEAAVVQAATAAVETESAFIDQMNFRPASGNNNRSTCCNISLQSENQFLKIIAARGSEAYLKYFHHFF